MSENNTTWAEDLPEYREQFHTQLRTFVQAGLNVSPLQAALECDQLYTVGEVVAAAVTGCQMDIPVDLAVAVFIILDITYTHKSRAEESIFYRFVLSRIPPRSGSIQHKKIQVSKVAFAILNEEKPEPSLTREFADRFVVTFANTV